MKQTIEIPDGYELVEEGNIYKVVKKEDKWPKIGDEYEYINVGWIIKNTFSHRQADKNLRESGNIFKPGQAHYSALYHIQNSKYYYWWPECEQFKVPVEVPESLEGLNCYGAWIKTNHFGGASMHRWLKSEGVVWE